MAWSNRRLWSDVCDLPRHDDALPSCRFNQLRTAPPTQQPQKVKCADMATTTTRRKPATKRATPPAPSPDVHGSVPDASYATSYVHRTIIPASASHAAVSDFDIFDRGLRLKQNILLEGPTGCAKTSAVLAYAAERKVPFYAIPSNIGIEPSQLFGKFVPSPDGSFEWVDGPVTSIIRTGGVLLINEVNFMPDRVATVLFGLLDRRREITLLDHHAEVIRAADDLLIVADMNPEYEGTRPLNKAFRNRFALQLLWGYDKEVEYKLCRSKALVGMATKLRTSADQGGVETPCSTNMLMELEQNFQDMGWAFATYMFLSHYPPEERGPVTLVLDTYAQRIQNELDTAAAKKRAAEERRQARAEEKRLADLRAELEPEIDKGRADKQRLLEVDDPEDPNRKTIVLVDDEWGVFGENWEW